jgi:hypothetical protein
MNNTGIDLAKERSEASTEDWQFGAFSQPCIASIPIEDRIKYLPKGEVQRGVEDFMDCATRGPINILEIKFNYLLKNKKFLPENEAWLREKGYIDENGITFSDRFIAIRSGTSRTGNSLKAPLEAIRKQGLIPKRMLPSKADMTFGQYIDNSEITGSMLALGIAFTERFPINYEKVLETHYEEANKDDPLNVAGFAWPAPKGTIYPRTEGEPNHVWVNLFPKYTAFDNYLDTDGDFIKQLASDYDFYEYGYRIFMSQKLPEPSKDIYQLMGQALKWMGQLLGILEKKSIEQKESTPLPTPPITKHMNNKEKFIKVCLDALDTDVTPEDREPDELACSATICKLLQKVFPDFPYFPLTTDLFYKLKVDKRFKAVLEPGKGKIVISPRIGTTPGHVGVWITEDKIASNTSKTGLFQGNYMWASWIREMRDRRGLKIYIFDFNE